MTDFFAIEKRNEFKQRLTHILAAHNDALRAIAEFNKLIGSNQLASAPSKRAIIKSFYQEWLTQELRSFTAAGMGQSSATITELDLPDNFRCITEATETSHLVEKLAEDDYSEALVAALCAAFPFEGLFESLDELSAGLEDKGFAEAAERLSRVLYLTQEHSHVTSMHPVPHSRFIRFNVRLFTPWSDSYGSGTYETIRQLVQDFEAMAADSGVGEAADAMATICRQFEESSVTGVIPSRTKLNDGGVIEGTVFKGKLQLKVPRAIGESLIAFCKIHSRIALNADLIATQVAA